MKSLPTILRSRIYPRNPVVEGHWYHTLTCIGCGQMIYLFEDNSKGEVPLNLSGDLELIVPCPRCIHDDIYRFSQLKSISAEESFEGFRPKRVPISKSSRKPLIPQFKHANPIMGVGLIEDRPQAAAIVARIITSWADIEVQCARLLAQIMGTNVPAAAAVFSSLRSSRAQSDALNAAAKSVLDLRDMRLFHAYIDRKAALEKERNDLAHGCFGISVNMAEQVIWVSQSDFINFTTRHDIGTDSSSLEAYKKRMFVYELGTLERIAQEIIELHEQFETFIGYLRISDPDFRKVRYSQLCEQPHIRDGMRRTRRG